MVEVSRALSAIEPGLDRFAALILRQTLLVYSFFNASVEFKLVNSIRVVCPA